VELVARATCAGAWRRGSPMKP